MTRDTKLAGAFFFHSSGGRVQFDAVSAENVVSQLHKLMLKKSEVFDLVHEHRSRTRNWWKCKK